MPRIEVNLADTHEPQPVPAGQRYKLTIAEAEFRPEKNDIRVSIGIDEHVTAPNVTHFISLPKPEDDEKKANFKRIMLARFLYWFGIPQDGDAFDTDDFPGATAELDLSLSEPNDNGDVYNRLVLPRLPRDNEGGEAAVEAETPAPAPAPARAAARGAAPAAAPARGASRGAPAPAARPAGRRR